MGCHEQRLFGDEWVGSRVTQLRVKIFWQITIHTSDHKIGINWLRPRLNRRPFADDIFKCIFLNENKGILPRFSLKFVPKVRINNIPPLVQIMAWRRPGDKPLSEPMMVRLPTHICVTRPQWVNNRNLCVILFFNRSYSTEKCLKNCHWPNCDRKVYYCIVTSFWPIVLRKFLSPREHFPSPGNYWSALSLTSVLKSIFQLIYYI